MYENRRDKTIYNNNYKILAERSKVKSNKGDIITIWGLNYRMNDKPIGFVNELGLIKRKKAKIEIENNELKTVKKPFFLTWNKVLKNINKMLEDMIANLDNSDVVKKRYVNLLCFSNDFAEKVSRIHKKL